MDSCERKEDTKLVVPISFGNPSNEMIYAELHVSSKRKTLSKVVVIINISTDINFKELCDFIVLHSPLNAQFITHMKIVSQEINVETEPNEEETVNAHEIESFYAVLCAFHQSLTAQSFMKDLNEKPFISLEYHRICQMRYLSNGCIIIIERRKLGQKPKKNDQNSEEMQVNKITNTRVSYFPPKCMTNYTTFIKHQSIPDFESEHENELKMNEPAIIPPVSLASPSTTEEEVPKCAYCFDIVQPPMLPPTISSPVKLPINESELLSDNSQFHLFRNYSQTSSNSPSNSPNLTPTLSIKEPKHHWFLETETNISTVCFVLCNHFFHVKCLLRCNTNSCPICRHYLFPEAQNSCLECLVCSRDLWQCITCGHIGCGRGINGCALIHYERTLHLWAKEIHSNLVWDYVMDDYVWRILTGITENELNEENSKMVVMSTRFDDGIDGSMKNLPRDLDQESSIKQEEIIYQYNFLCWRHLKSIQEWYEYNRKHIKKCADIKLKEIEHKINVHQKDIKMREKKMVNIIKRVNKEFKNCTSFVNDEQLLNAQMTIEMEQNPKYLVMEKNFMKTQERLKREMEEYENILDSDFIDCRDCANIKIHELQDQLRDYKQHIIHKRKMEKSVGNNNNARIEIDGSFVSLGKEGQKVQKRNPKRAQKNKNKSKNNKKKKVKGKKGRK